jgi:predicted N-acetyltransferase YhbS
VTSTPRQCSGGGRDADIAVRPATVDDISAMTTILGEAFHTDDPFGEYLFPDPHARPSRQRQMLAAMIRHRFIPPGCAEVAIVDGKIVGALLWHGHDNRVPLYHSAAGGLALVLAMRSRVFAGMALDAMFAKLAPNTPHVVGVYLACTPGLQLRGVGTTLGQSLLAKCERDGLELYLTCKDGNVNYYERFGFTVIGHPRLGQRGPVVNLMVRPPGRR